MIGVFTNDYRCDFVNGWLTGGIDPADGSAECGYNTAFPLELTLDQVAEVMYRDKDSHFTGGSITYDVSGLATLYASTTVMTNRAYYVSSATQFRGYQILGTDTYNGSTYDIGNGTYHSEIADNERGMWRDIWNDTPMTHAFTYEADDPDSVHVADSDWFNLAGSVGVEVKVVTQKIVAVVKTDPSHSDFAPGNRYFLGIEFYFHDHAGTGPTFGQSTNAKTGLNGNFDSTKVTASNYVMRLSSGDASCPIYTDAASYYYSATDFIHEAVEWWPYGKNSPADPVWNTATGARL